MNRLERYAPWSDKEIRTLAEATRQRERMPEAEHGYLQKLTRIVVAVCPFCGHELHRAFDQFVSERLWWRADAVPEEPPACTHFHLLCGAVAYGNVPPEADFKVQPGPDLPYVIPAILSVKFIAAVIGLLPMENGCLAYPIASFGERRLPAEELTADWRCSIYNYANSRRDDRWRIPDETWDFELEQWITAGHVRSCPPDSRNMRLNTAGDACPYAGLPGHRQRMILFRSLVRTWAPPTDTGLGRYSPELFDSAESNSGRLFQ